MVGTWGQLLFPKPWKEFRLWYDIQKAKGIKPILQGMVTTGWYKKMGERIWTPWFIKFIQSRGYYNIYTNFFPERALSVSHRDAGVNYGKTAGPDSQLIDKRSLDFNLWEMHSLRNLKWYDFCFKEVIPNRVVGSFDELGSVLNTVHKLKIVLLVSLYRTPESITRNLLCHFERLDIRNYILIGGDSELLLDLARRGHPVIDPLQLIKDVRTPKLREFQGSNKEFIMEILVKAYVIKKCVEFGFHTWSINANVVPISESFPQVPNVPYDFSTGKNLELLFVKSSQATAKIWVEEFIYKMASYANSLMDKTSLSKDQTNFGYIAAKYLEEKGQGIITVDEMSLGVKIDSNNIDTQILLEGAKKMIFWSSVMSLDSIQNRLEDVGMWVIDEGFSCTAVVCHQS